MAIMDLFTSLQTIINERSAKKVRQSIHDGIFRANQVVDANRNLVDQVAIRQDAVEQYNNQMIAEMTDKDVISAPEIIQMRDGEATANDRLLRDFKGISNKTGNAFSVEEFGAVGDGSNDDSDAIQLAFDTVPEHSTLRFLNDRYRITKPITVTKGYLDVKFDNVTFVWDGVDVLDSDGHGAIQFLGEVLPDRNFISNIVKSESDMTLSLLGSLDAYSVGDYVSLVIRSGTHDGTYNDYKPNTATTAKIMDITGDVIKVDYISPFDYSKLTCDGWISPMVPLKGLKLGDVNFEYASTRVETDRRVHCLSLASCVDFEVGRVSANAFKNKGIRLTFCRDGLINGGWFTDPTELSGGMGYGIQATNSCYLEFYNLGGRKLRHLIDFSQSHHIKVYNSKATDCFNRAFDCHGITEHDIEFIDCDGDYIFSNGVAEFASVVENITIVRGVVRGVSIGSVKNLHLKEVDVKHLFFYADVLNNFKAENCQIAYTEKASRSATYNARGYFESDGYFEMINCHFDFKNLGEPRILSFNNYRDVVIRGNRIRSIGESGQTAHLGFIEAVGFKSLTYSDNTVLNGAIRFSGTAVQDIELSNNKFKNTMVTSVASGAMFIDIVGSISGDTFLNVRWVGNSFYSLNPSRWIRVNAAVGNGNSVLMMFDNVFGGDLSEHLGGGTLFDSVERRNRGNVNYSTLASSSVISFEN